MLPNEVENSSPMQIAGLSVNDRTSRVKNKFGLGLSFFSLSLLLVVNLSAQQRQSDNGDGTYINPVIYSNFPDPDVIRLDSTYYLISTTMFIFPGVTILRSYDLVNWEYCSTAAQLFDFSPCYNLDGCNRYSHGQWATS